ncbi:MAG TPA: hypothetical protein VL983_03210 [Terriglobales bacterium]|nr:hypothetical protein [Terriglobales bacterium]
MATDKPEVEVLGRSANAGVLLRGESTGDCIGNVFALEKGENLTKEAFLSTGELRRNGRGDGQFVGC